MGVKPITLCRIKGCLDVMKRGAIVRCIIDNKQHTFGVCSTHLKFINVAGDFLGAKKVDDEFEIVPRLMVRKNV